MQPNELKNLMDDFSGGSEGRYRHVFNRKFIFTEGVKAVADKAGCYWLLDIVATECAPLVMKNWLEHGNSMCLLQFDVETGRAALMLTDQDDAPPLWTRSIDYTDFPEGSWVFKLAVDGLVDAPNEVVVMCLLQED